MPVTNKNDSLWEEGKNRERGTTMKNRPLWILLEIFFTSEPHEITKRRKKQRLKISSKLKQVNLTV